MSPSSVAAAFFASFFTWQCSINFPGNEHWCRLSGRVLQELGDPDPKAEENREQVDEQPSNGKCPEVAAPEVEPASSSWSVGAVGIVLGFALGKCLVCGGGEKIRRRRFRPVIQRSHGGAVELDASATESGSE